MEKQIKVLERLLLTMVGIMTLGVLFTFLFMIVNEDKLAFYSMASCVYSIIPLFFIAVVLDTKIRRE